jgi:hypothetical protein
MVNPEEQTRSNKVPWPMHVLQTVYFRFRQYSETANQNRGGQTSFPVEVAAAFQALKEAICRALLTRSQEAFVVDTDAFNVGIGGVLSQIQNGQEQVTTYNSKTMNEPERNYCVTRFVTFWPTRTQLCFLSHPTHLTWIRQTFSYFPN